MTMVFSEDDITGSLEEASDIVSQPRDVFVVSEIFESDARDLPNWTGEALLRAESVAQYERNMAVLYWWSVQYFPMMEDGGVIATQRTTPLAPDDIVLVFQQLAQREDYRSFQFLTRTEEGGHIIEYRGGDAYVNGEVVQAA